MTAAKGSKRGSVTPRVDPQRPPDPNVEAAGRETNPLRRALIVLGPSIVVPTIRLDHHPRVLSGDNGLTAAPHEVILMVVSNNRRAVGARTNGRLLNAIGWFTAAVMGVAGIALIVTTIRG